MVPELCVEQRYLKERITSQSTCAMNVLRMVKFQIIRFNLCVAQCLESPGAVPSTACECHEAGQSESHFDSVVDFEAIVWKDV
jgi:hypothetical protein